MKIEKIKPIPKYIQKKIKLYDDKLKTAPFGRTRFYAYFTKNDGELVKVTVAVREYKKRWYCKPVVIHGIHSDRCFGKDIKFTFIAGYSVGWHEQGLSKYPDWYESNDWGWSSDDSFDPYAPIVNRDYICNTFPNTNTAPLTDILAYTFSNTYGFTNSIRKSNILLNSAYTALLCQHRFYGFAVRIKSSANGLQRTGKILFYPTTTFLLS